MPQDGSDVLSSVKSIGEYFRVDKSKSSLCFLLTDRQQLNGFKEIVAEPVVELPFYAFDFILALLGKRNRFISCPSVFFVCFSLLISSLI